MDNRSIGKRLRELRKKRGYKSQEAFAEAINVIERKTVSKWETGEAAIPIKKLAEICDVLDCDLDYLFGKIDVPKNAVQSVMQQTKLSEKAVDAIIKTKRKDVLSAILESENFSKFVKITADCSDMEIDNTQAKMIAVSVIERGGLRFEGEAPGRGRLNESELKMIELLRNYNPTILSRQLAKDAAEKVFDDATLLLFEEARKNG